MGPVPPGEVAVPAQQGERGDDPAQLAELACGQQPGQRGQHRTAGPRQPRVLDLPLEHGHLMAQDEDFGVLPAPTRRAPAWCEPGLIGPSAAAA